ncbi:MAG: class I SAM-dependent methyltransferase [Phycisphaera sp.]|nr:MAG: class I SAM-dependent methyltransferase [Phycisphaera sp.]
MATATTVSTTTPTTPARTPRIGRMAFLRWPLMDYRNAVDLAEPNEGLTGHIGNAKYSLRLQRYWWAARAIQDGARQAAKEGREYVVVDLGCERGWMKRFTEGEEDAPTNIRWIGLDGNLDHPSLEASHYDETHACDFLAALPVPDDTADAVVCLHVFEHLKDVEGPAKEVARMLKPGGVFLAGTPVGPTPLAIMRTKQLVERDRQGRNRHWGHIRKFCPASWRTLCRHAGLDIEMMTGSHAIRQTKSPLENFGWWIRLNQLWGVLFPSLGQEVYLAARKPAAGEHVEKPGSLARFWGYADWSLPVAAVLVLVALPVVLVLS